MTSRQRNTRAKTTTMNKPKKQVTDPTNKLTDAQLKSKWTDMSQPSQLIPTICMGIIFGFVLNKGRVFEPEVIVNQFQFSRWIMMKMFLSAAATSILAISLLKFVAPKQYTIARASKAKYNLMASIVGGSILGMGMSISGACPGMVLIQMGANISNSFITFIGGILGALTYGLIEPFIRTCFTNKTISYAFMDDIIHNTYLLSIIFSLLMFTMVFILEYFFPWKSELTIPLQLNCNWITCNSWSPITAGIIVGLIQIPSILLLGTPIGSSSSYLCIVGQWLRLLKNDKQNFFKGLKKKINSFWQVVYVCSAIFGSMLAVKVSASHSEPTMIDSNIIKGIGVDRAFIGGFLMIFGSRIATGCTSGHGLSGMGMLSIASMIAVAAMFIGGGLSAVLI